MILRIKVPIEVVIPLYRARTDLIFWALDLSRA